MAVHWFAWLCFGLAGVATICFVFNVASSVEAMNHGDKAAEDQYARRAWWYAIGLVVIGLIGVISALQSDAQNSGLAARNTRYFKHDGYRVISAYGHKVCIAAGPHKLCLQERKDATGKKQLVEPLAHGGWALVDGPGGGFMDAVSHAPIN